jgi:hypothetical protein
MGEFFQNLAMCFVFIVQISKLLKTGGEIAEPPRFDGGEAVRRMALGRTELACEADRGLRSTQRVSADWVGLKSSLNAKSL